MFRTAQTLIDAATAALPLSSSLFIIRQCSAVEVFVDAEPAAGESFVVELYASPDDGATLHLIDTLDVSESEPQASTSMKVLGTVMKAIVKPGNTETEFTGTVRIVKVWE